MGPYYSPFEPSGQLLSNKILMGKIQAIWYLCQTGKLQKIEEKFFEFKVVLSIIEVLNNIFNLQQIYLGASCGQDAHLK